MLKPRNFSTNPHWNCQSRRNDTDFQWGLCALWSSHLNITEKAQVTFGDMPWSNELFSDIAIEVMWKPMSIKGKEALSLRLERELKSAAGWLPTHQKVSLPTAHQGEQALEEIPSTFWETFKLKTPSDTRGSHNWQIRGMGARLRIAICACCLYLKALL